MLPTTHTTSSLAEARRLPALAWLRCATTAWLISAVAALVLVSAALAEAPDAELSVTPGFAAAGAADLMVAAPGVQITTTTSYYAVEGSTWTEVANSLRADAAGDWAASTTWQFTTSYPYDVTGRLCRAGPVSVLATINYRLPSWTAPTDAPPDLIDTWTRFSDGVRVHEAGHRDLAVAAAVALADALRSLPPQPSCAEFEQLAQSTTADVMRQHDRDQVAYDLGTQHGLTQGAVFG
jgi:predicted secreted Zn-dependent protease